MRILLINPILYTAETDEIPKVRSIKDTMIYTMCLGFIEKGVEPILVAADDYRPEEEEEYPFEIVWMATALKKICKPRCFPWLLGLGSYIKKHKDDIDGIITSEVFSLCSFVAIRKMPKKTVIWHELGAHNKFMHYIPSKIWYNIITKVFFGKALVVARSDKARHFIAKYCRRVSNTVIDHGVDIHRIKVEEKKENSFVVVSQLIGRKRIDKAIVAFADFLKQGGEYEDYVLNIIGDGEQREELKGLAEKLGIQKSVIFHGRMTHEMLAPIVARAKAMLVYTEKDNNMVSVVESIAAGTPVITTSVPFNAAYIEREGLGIVQDDWGSSVLSKICCKNEIYVKNCTIYREKLAASYMAGQFIEIFTKMEKESYNKFCI